MAERTLSEQEMINTLEDIARNGRNAAAKIAAIKMLKEWGVDEPDDDFAGLDELAPRRKSAA